MSQTRYSLLLATMALTFALGACGDESDFDPDFDFYREGDEIAPAAESLATNATVMNVMADNCHRYIIGLNPMRFGPIYGTHCSIGARVISVTHEDENLGNGDMFGLPPPPDGQYASGNPWNVSYQQYYLDLALDNRQAIFPNYLSNNGRPIHDGFIGTFLNIPLSRAASAYTTVRLTFEDKGSTLELASAARVMLGAGLRDGAGVLHFAETNLRIRGSWDFCTSAFGPSSQLKGTSLGLTAYQACDPTSNNVIDYRSYNQSVSELVYVNGPALFAPAVSGATYTYSIPVSALVAAYPWKAPGASLSFEGLYFGFEHHKGAKTRVVLKDLVIVDSAPTSAQAAALSRMRQELTAPTGPQLIGTLESATAVSTGFKLRGWACTTGVNGATEVHVRARPNGTTGQGTWLRTVFTSGSTSSSTSACKNGGGNVFDVVLPSSLVRPYLGQQVVIVAKNNVNGTYGMINAPSSSVTFKALTPTVAGVLDSAAPVTNGFQVRGWACTVGVNGATEVHIRARPNGTTGIGTWLKTILTSGSTSYSTTACQNSGNNVFDVVLPGATIQPYLGQQVVILAKNNADGTYSVLNAPSSSVVYR